MEERADPDIIGFTSPYSKYRERVIERYNWANTYTKGVTLDIPCGMGWGSSLLTNAKIVMGVDNNLKAIKKGEILYPNISFHWYNMLCTGFISNAFDTIVCCEGYEHVNREEQFRLINELHRLIKPSGIAVFSVSTVQKIGQHSGNEYHLYEPTEEEFRESIKDKFEIIELIHINGIRGVMKPND